MRMGYGPGRRMWRRMMMHGACYGPWEEPSIDDQIAFLEEYQRDLEQETADVAEKVRRLREEKEKETV